MLACWAEDPNGESYKKHLARIADFIWVAEDGMKMQVSCLHISGFNFSFLVGTAIWATKVLFLIHCTHMQSFGSQMWDASFAIQALLAANLNDELGSVLKKGHDFLKKSQVSVLTSSIKALFLLPFTLTIKHFSFSPCILSWLKYASDCNILG